MRPRISASQALEHLRLALASSAVVGSSSTSTGGSRSSVRAMPMPLALAAGQAGALRAELGVVAVGQARG